MDTPTTRPAKVRGVALPQEYQLTQFIQHVHHPHPSWNSETEVCKWDGVKCPWRADGPESVVRSIYWGHRELQGTLRWEFLPQSLVEFSVEDNKLTGEVGWQFLPGGLRYFNLGRNVFSGTPDFTNLPSSLRDMFLNNNKFHGSVKLNTLPANMQWQHLDENEHLTGDLEVCYLPFALRGRRTLVAGGTKIEGYADLPWTVKH